MKKIIVPIAAIALAAGIYVFGPKAPRQEETRFSAPDPTQAASLAGDQRAVQRHRPMALKTPRSNKAYATNEASSTVEVLAQQRQTLAKYGAKPMPTPDERAASEAIANSEAFQKQVFATLSGAAEFVFDAETEKERLRHLQIVMDVYRFGDDATRDIIAEELEELIFSTGFLETPDIALRKSLAGDKIDFLRILKDLFPERFAKVSERIESSADPLLTYCLSEV